MSKTQKINLKIKFVGVIILINYYGKIGTQKEKNKDS